MTSVTLVTGASGHLGANLIRRLLAERTSGDPGRPADESVPFYPFEKHMPYERSKAWVEHECLRAAVDGQDVVVATSCAILGPHDYKPSRMGRLVRDFATGQLAAYIPGGF